MAIMRNFEPERAPEGFPISQIVNLFKPSSTSSNSDRNDRMKTQQRTTSLGQWRVLCVEGMWFQDLFNYDFRRTEMCVIPYGTQEGEISFCAYNTGVGWRQIIEEMHKTAGSPSGTRSTAATPFTPRASTSPASRRRARSSLPIVQARFSRKTPTRPSARAPRPTSSRSRTRKLKPVGR